MENSYTYPPDGVNDFDLSGMCPWCVVVLFPIVYKALTIAVASQGGVGGARTPKQQTVKQSAYALSKKLNQNTVQIKNSKGITNYDLRGKPHYNKKTGKQVPTPHVQHRGMNNGFYGNKGPARPMTYQDLRNVKNYSTIQNRR